MNTILEVIIAGFSIGILGSFHCVGMCGPLALALPINHQSSVSKFFSIILYNLGRALSYAALGVIFGMLGQSFAMFKLQQILSISAGILILVLLYFGKLAKPSGAFWNNITGKVSHKLATFLQGKPAPSAFISIGILNGFLPCGLVYIAVAAALAAGSIVNSGLLMFSFGLGTMPIMALTMALGKFISIGFRTKLNKATPYFVGCLAVLLILRGLSLGIPYISPVQEKEEVSCCHHH